MSEIRAHELLGATPPTWFDGDGCTAVSDTIWGVDVTPACKAHDWAYHMREQATWRAGGYRGPGHYVPRPNPIHDFFVGDRVPGRLEADFMFGYNTARILEAAGIWKPYAGLRGLGRLVGVQLLGRGRGMQRWARIGSLAAVLALSGFGLWMILPRTAMAFGAVLFSLLAVDRLK